MAKVTKWWEKEELPTTVWRACVSENGLDYYYNSENGTTSWDKPEELMSEVSFYFVWVNISFKYTYLHIYVPRDAYMCICALYCLPTLYISK